MNENLNLVEILKDCPEGTKLYSLVAGEVEFKRIVYSEYPIVTYCKHENRTLSFTKEGYFFPESVQDECLMLFPSKEQRDWSKFKKPKFDPKTLKPFDKVLIRDSRYEDWSCDIFSHIHNRGDYHFRTITAYYAYCIPYNNDTKHLVGTTDEAPEYYRYWED